MQAQQFFIRLLDIHKLSKLGSCRKTLGLINLKIKLSILESV